jgi:hypothetical protein
VVHQLALLFHLAHLDPLHLVQLRSICKGSRLLERRHHETVVMVGLAQLAIAQHLLENHPGIEQLERSVER